MNKKTLVLGASLNTSRYSYMAILKLKNYNHEVVALGVKEGVVADVKIDVDRKNYTDLDTVTLYINPTIQKEYYNYIISLQPKRVIFNPGTENSEFMKLLRDENIKVEVACTLVLLSTNQY